ncbi:MAG: alpha/beta hydrolase [Hyphomicrobiaceae bacterium]|nr:alpha/beta hydrolase [Hyphomicrobiaceae bacterium]
MQADAAKDYPFEEIRFTTRDGLRLYGRRYRAHKDMGRRPVLCLAGLTRNSRDFHDIATALSQHADAPRDVFTLDSRGRGGSDHDADWRNYSVPVEMQDALDFMARSELADVAIIGTSRGGLLAMVMGAARPTAIGAVVLNDIGPVIETEGLLRIAGYVGRTPPPSSWTHAGELSAQIYQRQFPGISAERWQQLARQWFNDEGGRPVASYDAKLSRALSVLDGPMPTLWPQFATLNRVPVMVIRGANSDLLSDATVEEMGRRHPALAKHVVAGEGHAPLLQDTPTVAAVARFLDMADLTRH